MRLRFGSPLVERLPIVRIEEHPLRGWAMLPDEDHYTYQHLVEINSLGLRGPEPSPGTGEERRLLVLGDSMTYGQGVANDQTLPHHLERQLEQLTGSSFCVVNGGHRGYGTNQELGLLEELGEALSPDVVVLCWYWNDLKGETIENIRARFAGRGPVAQDVQAPLEGSLLLRWHAVQLLRRSALLMKLHDLVRARKPYPYERLGTQGIAHLGRLLRRFEQLTEQLGATPVVALIPDPVHVRVDEHPTGELARRAAGVARERGLCTVELVEPLQLHLRETGEVPVLPYDGHYEAEGNRLMGEFLAQRLLELEVIGSEQHGSEQDSSEQH